MNNAKAGPIAFILGWSAAFLLFFPILWMLLTGFKTEVEAISTPPTVLFAPTMENYDTIFERADYLRFASNSIVISIAATVLALLLAIPAAYAMAFFPTERTRSTLLWMLSTKMMPAVGVLVPMYLIFRDTGLLDTRTGLIVIYTLINLPIAVWMLYTFFKEVPNEILVRPHGRGAAEPGSVLPAAAARRSRHRFDRPAVDHPVLERGVLEPEPDGVPGRTADRLHRLLLQPRRAVLGQAVRRLDTGHRADPDHGLVEPASARARPDLRRRQVIPGDLSWPI
jgi:hypothetical protein